MRPLRVCTHPVLFIVLVPLTISAQQFRQGPPDRAALSKAAVERRLFSKHPVPPADLKKAVPGKYLLDREAARASQLQARIRSTNAPRPLVSATSTTIFPGIQFRPTLPAGSISNAVATGDFNNDGHMDFVVANGGTNDLWIYLGKGDGTFQLPRIVPLTRGETPIYVVAADLRGNGTQDLIVAEYDTSTIGVLLGHGDGTFGFEQIYSLPQPPTAVVVDDFNHDGKPDIAAVMTIVGSGPSSYPYVATLFGDGTGSFASPVISPNASFFWSTATNIASGDVNNDGLPDLIISGPPGADTNVQNAQVYLNSGNGQFTPGHILLSDAGGGNFIQDARLGDFNEDGCLDAAVADATSLVWVALGDCKGNFGALTPVFMGDSNAALRLVDLNGDGHLDLVTTAIPALNPALGHVAGNTLSVAFGDGHGNFAPARNYVGTGQSYSLAIADFNRDGKPDVVSVSPDTDTATVYLNDGSGGFGSPQGVWIGVPGEGLINAPIAPASFADVNGDGKTDIVLLDEGYSGEYFLITLLNDGSGKFEDPRSSDAGITVPFQRMGDYRLADFRHTGHLDFLAIGLSLAYSSGAEYILFMPGNGDGTFGKPVFVATPGADGEMAIGDFNRDGNLDFAVVSPNSSLTGKVVTMFLGNGDGTFRRGGSVAFADTAGDIDRVYAGDFNRDGKLDILVHTTGNGYWTTNSSVWEFLGNGDGSLQPGKQLFSTFEPMVLADVNGDSWPDIVRYDFFWPDGITETYGPAKFSTYLDQPSGTFVQSSSYAAYQGIPTQPGPYLQLGDPTATSLVTDLNGDGKADEVAFQRVSASNPDVYAQILMGNGDGTFFPTYDVFDFIKQYYFPEYSHDLNGDGFADLLEIDSASSSMHVFNGGPAPALQIALEKTRIIGNSGCGWIFPNVPSPADVGVTLASSVAGVVLPASVTIPAGSLGQQFCYTLDTSYDWHQVFDIQATLGTSTAIAYASQSYVIGFTESLSPDIAQVVYAGQSAAPVTVTLTPLQNYSSTAKLSCLGPVDQVLGVPISINCAFGSSTLSLSPSTAASTTVTVQTNAASRFSGPVTIVADDGNVAARGSFTLSYLPLTVGPFGNNPQATSPGIGTTAIAISGIPPYTPSCSGLPVGLACSFTGTQNPYPSTTGLNLTITVPSGVAVGNYPFTVSVVSGPATASVALTLVVGDFSLLAPSAASDWAPPGGTVNATSNVQAVGSFTGSVSLSCSTDFGGNCTGSTINVSSAAPTPGGLTVSVPSTVALGAHTLTVTATSGSLSHVASFPFYVADYSGSLSASTLAVTAGASGPLSATVSATAGFAGTVSLSCAGTSQLSCSFSPTMLQPTANNSQTTNITVTAALTASTHPSREMKVRSLALTALFPIWAVWVFAGARREWTPRTRTVLIILFPFVLALSSCGSGGTSAVPQGGSTSYTLTVNASAAGTNTTRTLGTVTVTVTH